MMTNKEKFLALVSDDVTQTMARNHERIANRAWLYQSQEIAMAILDRLEDLDWTQRVLAEKMGVSPQQVNKIVRGKENLSLETLIKLQTILSVPIFASYGETQQVSGLKDRAEMTFESVAPIKNSYPCKTVRLNPFQVPVQRQYETRENNA